MDKVVFEKMLGEVQKPGRYIGNEYNSVKKDLSGVDIKFALCFPEMYEIGMSHLGFKLLYHLLNERADIACERAFAPAPDFEELLRKNNLPLFSLESKRPLKDFDIIGFSLSYEMTFTNVLNMMDLAGISLFAKERGEGDPLIIGGGVAAFNPEPIHEFFDLFVIGESEEVIFEIIEEYKKHKKKTKKRDLLKALSKIKGVYVPSLYKAEYNADGTLASLKPTNSAAPAVIEKRMINDLDKSFYPEKQIIPYIRVVHDRASLEIMRGCPNKCRFCQAWVIYHHKRERSLPRIVELSGKSQRLTGYDEVSLLSLSSGDHSEISGIIGRLADEFKAKGVCISLPSLRIEEAVREFPEVLKKLGIRGLTFAPEAGTPRMRKIINKNIDIAHLEETAGQLYKSGWRRVKLYFMIGLPGEGEEDLKGIVRIVHKLKGNITLSISSFMPKAHTPFQWRAMDSPDELENKFLFIRNKIKSRRVKISFHDKRLGSLEAVFSRGDRRLAGVIYEAFKNGAKFDSWSEHFKFEAWQDAFKKTRTDPGFYIYRKRGYEEILPWAHIKTGISTEYLIKESRDADNSI